MTTDFWMSNCNLLYRKSIWLVHTAYQKLFDHKYSANSPDQLQIESNWSIDPSLLQSSASPSLSRRFCAGTGGVGRNWFGPIEEGGPRRGDEVGANGGGCIAMTPCMKGYGGGKGWKLSQSRGSFIVEIIFLIENQIFLPSLYIFACRGWWWCAHRFEV